MAFVSLKRNRKTIYYVLVSVLLGTVLLIQMQIVRLDKRLEKGALTSDHLVRFEPAVKSRDNKTDVVIAPSDHVTTKVSTKHTNPVVKHEAEVKPVAVQPVVDAKPVPPRVEGSDVAPQYLTNAKIIAGVVRPKPAYLVIGLPTVNRSGATSYLMQTLQGLVDGLDAADKQDVIIVVFVADLDGEVHALKVAKEIKETFPTELSSGLIQVITAPASYYPKLTGLPGLYGDKPDRVYWRSKQCVDYAFMFGYAGNLGQYYLQLEDDVLTTSGYAKTIRNFVSANLHRRWLFLDFGKKGFIGMLFRREDTRKLSVFYKMYYWVAPIDFLFRHYGTFQLFGDHHAWAVYNPSLFLHIGKVSSLKGQVRQLSAQEKQALTKKVKKVWHSHKNPVARVTSSFQNVVNDIPISSVYDGEFSSQFWVRTVTVGDHVMIEFPSALKISKVVVESGNSIAQDDYIGGAKIETSATGNCDTFTTWKEFRNEKSLVAEKPTGEGIVCKCIRMTITEVRLTSQHRIRWLALREIVVWEDKP